MTSLFLLKKLNMEQLLKMGKKLRQDPGMLSEKSSKQSDVGGFQRRLGEWIKKLFLIATVFCVGSPICAKDVMVEVKGAYYYPTNHTFRKIYSNAGLVNLEASVQAIDKFYPWLSAGFLYTTGHSLGNAHRTELFAVPLGLGLKYIFLKERLRPYLGAGGVVAYGHIHNSYSHVSRNQVGWGVGGIAKSGLLVFMTSHVLLDFFVDYTYLKMSFNHYSGLNLVKQRADLSGFSFGAGVGYQF